jgi:hypothetical protein
MRANLIDNILKVFGYRAQNEHKIEQRDKNYALQQIILIVEYVPNIFLLFAVRPSAPFNTRDVNGALEAGIEKYSTPT